MSAIDTITAVLNLSSGGWSPIFTVTPTALMTTYFSDGFVADWSNAMQYIDMFPIGDGDPITGLQGVVTLTLLSTNVSASTPTTATVDAVIAFLQYGLTSPSSTIVTFSMLLQNGSWVIDDIDPHLQSLDKNGAVVNHTSFRADLLGAVHEATTNAASYAYSATLVSGYVAADVVDIPSAIAASGKVYGDGTPAALVAALCNISQPPSQWAPGDIVAGNVTTFGVAVATFNYNGKYGSSAQPNGVALKDDPQAGSSAGILVQQVLEGDGAGLYMLVQWPGQPAFINFYPVYGVGGDCAQNYCVIQN